MTLVKVQDSLEVRRDLQENCSDISTRDPTILSIDRVNLSIVVLDTTNSFNSIGQSRQRHICCNGPVVLLARIILDFLDEQKVGGFSKGRLCVKQRLGCVLRLVPCFQPASKSAPIQAEMQNRSNIIVTERHGAGVMVI